MTYSLQETSFAELTDLVDETINIDAFVQRRDDSDGPFLRAIPELVGNHPDLHCFAVSTDQARKVGYVIVLPHPREATLTIGPLYVSEQYRGAGLGRRLVTAAVEWARAAGARELEVATWGRNARARKLFEHLGFQLVGEIPDARVNGDSTVEYLLKVRAP